MDIPTIKQKNDSRGMSNKWTGSAVFMSEHIDDLGTYGDALFEVDLPQMKQDGYMPRLEREEPIQEGRVRQAIAREFGVEDYHLYTGESDSEGILESTLVLFGPVPPKYLKRLS